MFSKVAFFALLVATAYASGGYSSFSYDVSDPNTGDIKDQQENRVGGNVVGKYSLLESDGTKRIVEYSADDANGFKAVVHKEPVGAYGAAAFGTLGPAGALAGNFAHRALPAAGHVAPFAAASLLAHGGLANPLAGGLPGHASLYSNYGNTLGSGLGYTGRGEPTVSSYSHSIVHNGPDSYPYGGAYGRYGGYGAHGSALAQANPWAAGAGLTQGAALASANPWAPGTGLTSGLASPLAARAHGGYAAGLGYGNRLGW